MYQQKQFISLLEINDYFNKDRVASTPCELYYVNHDNYPSHFVNSALTLTPNPNSITGLTLKPKRGRKVYQLTKWINIFNTLYIKGQCHADCYSILGYHCIDRSFTYRKTTVCQKNCWQKYLNNTIAKLAQHECCLMTLQKSST